MTTWRLDPSSPVALYLQIVEQVRRLVALGALKDGDRLPTVRELAVQTRVNRNTAARAIQRLENEGVVRTRVGQGTFVVDGAERAGRRQRNALLDETIERLLDDTQALGLSLDDLRQRIAARIALRGESQGGAGRGEP